MADQKFQQQQVGHAPHTEQEVAESIKDAQIHRDSLTEPKSAGGNVESPNTRLDPQAERDLFGTSMSSVAGNHGSEPRSFSHADNDSSRSQFTPSKQEVSSGNGEAVDGKSIHVVLKDVEVDISSKVAAVLASVVVPTHAKEGLRATEGLNNDSTGPISTTYHVTAQVTITHAEPSKQGPESTQQVLAPSAPAPQAAVPHRPTPQQAVPVRTNQVQPSSARPTTAQKSVAQASAPAPAPAASASPPHNSMPPPAAPASMLANLKLSSRADPEAHLTDPSIAGHLLPPIVILFRMGKASKSKALGQFAIDLIGEALWKQELPTYMNAAPLPSDEEAVNPLLWAAVRIIRMEDAERAGYLEGLLQAFKLELDEVDEPAA
ncbi:uncharacterized protein LTR77_002933 [Saxophila tyrrhenica]|uniref:Uncharacterized protein n=1 Tax=Saxophila tyrrhenica TaxID=1690608 RepID=A0AAV9PHN7_9PEZI|nr:hypothetical protein LTR77_002933 [Saxophila tyrrhenica]